MYLITNNLSCFGVIIQNGRRSLTQPRGTSGTKNKQYVRPVYMPSTL